jgi:hypothetical protein
MNRVRVLGGAAALAGVALLAAPPAWATDTGPAPTTTPGPTSASPDPTAVDPPPSPPDAPPVAALPRTAVFSMTVAPHVTARGKLVTASGAGCASVHIIVNGPPTGWYDVPPNYLDRTVTAGGTTWRTTFPMPATASTVDVTCLDPGSTNGVEEFIAPASVPAARGWINPATDGLLSLDVSSAMDPLPTQGLFTETGKPVRYTLTPAGVVLFRAPTGAVSVTVIGWHFLGENAEAHQTSAVDWFTVQLPGVTSPTSSATPAPTTTGTGDGLALSGGPAVLLPVALLLIAGGAALARAPGTRGASTPTRT